jgi:ubiquinone/menaquinone biosynthesis C-methylase UbiE
MKKPEDSYRAHDEHLSSHLRDDGLRRRAETWMQTDTVDHWRHARMLDSLDPLLHCYPDSRWLTVGDGRWGSDARYILDRGSRALATDIGGSLLKEGKERGYIPEYEVQNAEHLTYEDSAFDFVLCKESYHHFPRPALALYEMLRVARRAVVLIEPQDEYPGLPLRGLKILIKRMTGRRFQTGYDSFEEVGNYVYTISKRELTKVALGLDLTHIAFRSLNFFLRTRSRARKDHPIQPQLSEVETDDADPGRSHRAWSHSERTLGLYCIQGGAGRTLGSRAQGEGFPPCGVAPQSRCAPIPGRIAATLNRTVAVSPGRRGAACQLQHHQRQHFDR